jgi:copper homeostasis protein
MKRILEICADSIHSAADAEEGGADRIELCENLTQGGVTPSAGKIRLSKQMLKIPVFVLIRPRKADFLYSGMEFQLMLEDIRLAKALKADGIVSGVLTADGSIDLPRTEQLIEAAWPLPFTFHRAIDMCRDPMEAAGQLADIGVKRILTSGQRVNASEGHDLIRRLVDRADGKLSVMAGGGLTPSNLKPLLSIPGLKEFHASARHQVKTKMEYFGRSPMGEEPIEEEFRWNEVDPMMVKALRRQLG